MKREVLADTLLIGLGALWLWRLIVVHIQGTLYTAYEDIAIIRWGETALFAFAFLLGIERLIHHLRKE